MLRFTAPVYSSPAGTFLHGEGAQAAGSFASAAAKRTGDGTGLPLLLHL